MYQSKWAPKPPPKVPKPSDPPDDPASSPSSDEIPLTQLPMDDIHKDLGLLGEAIQSLHDQKARHLRIGSGSLTAHIATARGMIPTILAELQRLWIEMMLRMDETPSATKKVMERVYNYSPYPDYACRLVLRAFCFGVHEWGKPLLEDQTDWFVEMTGMLDYVRRTLFRRVEVAREAMRAEELVRLGTTEDVETSSRAQSPAEAAEAGGPPLLHFRAFVRGEQSIVHDSLSDAPDAPPDPASTAAEGGPRSPKIIRRNIGDIVTGGSPGSPSTRRPGIRGFTLQTLQKRPLEPDTDVEANTPATTSNVGAFVEQQPAMEINRGAEMLTGRQNPITPLSTNQLGKQPVTQPSHENTPPVSIVPRSRAPSISPIVTRSRTVSIAPVVTRSRAASTAPAVPTLQQATIGSASNTGAVSEQAAVAGGSDTGGTHSARDFTPPPIGDLPDIEGEQHKTIDEIFALCDFLAGNGVDRLRSADLTPAVRHAIKPHLIPFCSKNGWIMLTKGVRKDLHQCLRHKLRNLREGTGEGMSADWYEPCKLCRSHGVPCMRRHKADPRGRVLVVPTTIRRNNQRFDQADPEAWVRVTIPRAG